MANTFLDLSLTLTPELYSGWAKLRLPEKISTESFSPILAIKQNNSIIHNSNSFLVDRNFVENKNTNIAEYDKHHNIFVGMNNNYKYLMDICCNNIIDTPMFLLANPFSGTNIGHDLSIIFDRIHYYKEHNFTCPVVVSYLYRTIPSGLDIINILLPNTIIYILEPNETIIFKQMTIPHNVIFDIEKHSNTIIKSIIESCIKMKGNEIDTYKNKKIFLVKNTSQKLIVTKSNMFECSKTMEFLRNNRGFIIINPEIMNIIDIILYVHYSTKIVTCSSAIQYAHGPFFSSNAKKYCLNCYAYFRNIRQINLPNYNIDNHMALFLSLIEE